MKLHEVLYEAESCEVVYVDADDNILTEGAVRQFKRNGQSVVRKYRCLAGPKKGKLVSSPSLCSVRKNPKKVRQGRKTMRQKKGIIARKTKIAKTKAMSKIVSKMNKRMMGNN